MQAANNQLRVRTVEALYLLRYTTRCSMRMRDRYGVLSLACASVYMCVRMFSARSVNCDDDEGGNNSCDKILLSSIIIIITSL